MSTSINRRQLGKGLMAGAALSAIGATAEAQTSSVGAPQLDSRWLAIAPGIWKARIGSPEAITPVSSRLVEPRTAALLTAAPVLAPPLAPPNGGVRSRGTSLTLPLAAGEELYGFGLQFFLLQHRGKKRTLRVNADPRFDTGDSHAPVPFYVSSLGYGVFVDTARYATFYCGESRDKPRVAVDVANGGVLPMSTEGLYSKGLSNGQNSQILVDVPGARGVDVYLFGGPTMLDAVKRYNLFSGGGVNPPEWGLGFWYRASANATDSDLVAFAQEFRDRKIPCDVLGLEPGWQTHAYSCTYVWNKQRYPDPAGFVKQLKARNYRVNLWEHAFIHPSSPLFTPMVNLSGDKGVWGGLVPDFHDPKARQVFGDFHGTTLLDSGIDGFKLDECDNSDYTGAWSFPEVSQFPSGPDGEQMHSLFGLGYQRALWKQFKQRGRLTYGLVRSSGALASPYPFVLYSDLYDHRQFVRALVNSSFSGLLWCPEVRDAKSEEDLIRRLQTVVFSPLAMINGWYIPNPPWKQLDRKKNNANDLSPNWEKLEGRCREIIGWRMQLVPYLRAAFARYATDGTPPFRALALDWPNHPEVAKTEDAWMVGDRMLVAPLFAGEPGRRLTLPPGHWRNFWTGEAVSGDIIDIPAATKDIPVFVMDGSVLPLASITNSTADPESRNLEVRVFGDGRLPFSLLTPEGDSLQLNWNAKTRAGAVKQQGNNRYTITTWASASRTDSQPA
jgi:alpha-D-xyloside xylohydrolase